MYSLFFLLNVLSTFFLIRALEERRLRWWALNILCNTLLMATHAFSICCIMGQFVLLFAVCLLRRKPKALLGWCLAQVPGAGALAWWVSTINFKQLAVAGSWCSGLKHTLRCSCLLILIGLGPYSAMIPLTFLGFQ